MEKLLQYESCSAKDTFKLGKKIGEQITSALVVLLSGELGTGKTVFCKGCARALDIEDDITSPTYTLINEYEGKLPLYHIDLYRIDREEELTDIGFEEYLKAGGVVLIEWPQLAEQLLPPQYLLIRFKMTGVNHREIIVEARGDNKVFQKIKRLEIK